VTPPSDPLLIAVLGFVGVTLVAVVGFFLRGMSADFRATANQVATVVATLGTHRVELDGLARLVGKLEGKLEGVERELSEVRSELAVAQSNVRTVEQRLADWTTQRRAGA
jgi:ABC-type transporter Mla subunit MlaD